MFKFTKGAIALVLAAGLFFSQTVGTVNASTLNSDVATTTRNSIIIHSAAEVLGKTPQEFLAELRALRSQGGLRSMIDAEGMTMKEFLEAFKAKLQSYAGGSSSGNASAVLRQVYTQMLTILQQKPTLAFYLTNRMIVALGTRSGIPAAVPTSN